MVAEGAKPPPSGAVPNPAAGAAGKTGAGAGAAAGGGIAAWWRSVTGQGSTHAASVGQHVHNVASTVRSKAQTIKFSGMPVDVKIDFLRPTLDTIKETLLNTWVQLPPQVQQAAPFVGVAIGTGLLVGVVQQRRLNKERENSKELTGHVKVLKKEKEELLKRLSLLKARSGSSKTDVEMVTALSSAVNAAAAAADAAARAATACIIRPGSMTPPAAA